MEATLIEVGEGDFDVAVVTFTGKVRNHNLGAEVSTLTLEHYPGMTEKALAEIAAQARERWPLTRIALLHRVGELGAGERIVFVGVSGAQCRRIYDGYSQNPGAVLETGVDPRRQPLAGRTRQRSTRGRTLARLSPCR